MALHPLHNCSLPEAWQANDDITIALATNASPSVSQALQRYRVKNRQAIVTAYFRSPLPLKHSLKHSLKTTGSAGIDVLSLYKDWERDTDLTTLQLLQNKLQDQRSCL